MKSYQNSVDDPTFYHSFLHDDDERNKNRRSSVNPFLLVCFLTIAIVVLVFNLSSEVASTYEIAVGNPGRITDAELSMIVQALAAADVQLSPDYQDLNTRISFVDVLPVDPDNADAQACAKIADKKIYIKGNTDDSGDKRLSYLKTVAHETSHLMHFVQGWDISPLGAVGDKKQFTPFVVDVGHHPAGRDATFLTEVRAHYVQLAFEKMFEKQKDQTRLAGRYEIWVSKGILEVTIPITGVDGTDELTQIDVRTMSRNAMSAKPECEVTGAHVTYTGLS